MNEEKSWAHVARSETYRDLRLEVRQAVKQKYFERIMAPEMQADNLPDDEIQALFQRFMEQPSDTGEALPVSMLGQTVQTFLKPLHLPLTSVGSETLDDWGTSLGDAAFIHFPVNEIHRDHFSVRYVGTGLGCLLWVLLTYSIIRYFKALRVAKNRARMGPRLTELEAFEKASAEVSGGSQRQEGLWSKCYSENGGDDQQTRAAYLKARAAQIRAQDAIRPYTGDPSQDAPIPSSSFVSRHGRPIAFGLALAFTILSLVAPPVIFKKTISSHTELHVEYRYLWDMKPRSLPPYNGIRVFNEYAGIDFARLALQLVGIAALTGGFLAATGRLKRL